MGIRIRTKMSCYTCICKQCLGNPSKDKFLFARKPYKLAGIIAVSYRIATIQSLLKRKTWVYLKEHRPCTPPPSPDHMLGAELYRRYGEGSYPLGLLPKCSQIGKLNKISIRPMYNKFELKGINHLVTSCMTLDLRYPFLQLPNHQWAACAYFSWMVYK